MLPLSIHENGARFAKSLGRDFKGARVAWFKDLGGVPLTAESRSINARKKLFESLGCIVEEAEPDLPAPTKHFASCAL